MNTAPDPDPLRTLAAAQDMIARTRSTMVDRSAYYFIWGALVLIACVWTYAITIESPSPISWLPWAVLMPVGAIASLVRLRRDRMQSHVQTYAEHTLDGVWLAAGLAAAVILFGNPVFHYFPAPAVYVLLSILIGLAVFASGHVMGLLSFKLAGAVWWGAALVMMALPDLYHPLLMAAAIPPGYLLPAFLLRNHVRLEKNR